ncbi:MAG: DUF4432 family protein [Firmicutes bacterium]|nr:DUF4432 family protein [Bacillota bacterium]
MLGKRGARIETGWQIAGYRAIVMENAVLRVVMLPDKGMDIVELLYKPRDVDFTASTPWGLSPPDSGNFLDRYEGGFQIIFPNGGLPSEYRGAPLGQHDEVALSAWEWHSHEDRHGVQVVATLALRKTPFAYQRVVRLAPDSPHLYCEDKVINRSPFDQAAMWGQHLAFGPPFLAPSCRLATGARAVLVVDEPLAPRRFKPGRYAWPWVEGVDGRVWDLRNVPPPDGTHDMAYLTEFAEPWYTLENPDLGVGVRVSWDNSVWPQCWVWQEGGADGYPWYGRHYSLGLEPFCGYPTHGLDAAIRNGSALKLPGGAEIVGRLDIVAYGV